MFVIGSVMTIIKIIKACKNSEEHDQIIIKILNDPEILEIAKSKGYL